MVNSEFSSVDMLSDEQLVFRINSGNNDSLQILLSRYIDTIRFKAAAISPDLDPDDIVQEGLIALYSAIRVFDPSISKFSTFANLCIERAIYSEIRKLNRKRVIPQDMLVYEFEADDNAESDPESLFIQKEECSAFTDKIKNSLSDFEYRVLLCFLELNSYEKIAEKLCVSQKSVDNALSRLRKKIKEIN